MDGSLEQKIRALLDTEKQILNLPGTLKREYCLEIKDINCLSNVIRLFKMITN